MSSPRLDHERHSFLFLSFSPSLSLSLSWLWEKSPMFWIVLCRGPHGEYLRFPNKNHQKPKTPPTHSLDDLQTSDGHTPGQHLDCNTIRDSGPELATKQLQGLWPKEMWYQKKSFLLLWFELVVPQRAMCWRLDLKLMSYWELVEALRSGV
jgi:hypothetical protein